MIEFISSIFTHITIIFKLINIFLIISKEYMSFLYYNNYKQFAYNTIQQISTLNILYIKIFQTIAQNKYLLDDTFNDILVEYTDNVPYTTNDIDYYTISKIQNDYKLISDEDDNLTPINSGTIALIFKMYLIDHITDIKTPVIVKIKRKNIDIQLSDAIIELTKIINILSFIPFFNKIKLNSIVSNNLYLLKEQLNFQLELDNMTNYQNICKNVEYILIPTPYPEITKHYNNVIVMDYIIGGKLECIKHNDYKQFAKIFIKMFLLSILAGTIHGDLHSGNILFLDNKKQIALLDFGIVLKITENSHNLLLNIVQNIFTKNANELSMELLKIILNNYDALTSFHLNNLLTIVSLIITEIQTKGEQYNILKYFECMNQTIIYIDNHKLYEQDIELNCEFYKLNMLVIMASSIVIKLCDTDIASLIDDVVKEMFHVDILLN